jgi:hypothetical protein
LLAVWLLFTTGNCKTTIANNRETQEHPNIGNNFLNRTTIAQQLIESTDKWDYIKQNASAQQRK